VTFTPLNPERSVVAGARHSSLSLVVRRTWRR
jgi:hypothetical protein